MADEEVFILDLRRRDGTRFVTSVGTAKGISAARKRHGAVEGEVSHWRRDGYDPTGYQHPMDCWNLKERFSL